MEVKWIKITTNMFDNRKIRHLRRLPDGNSIVLIWVMLLTMAGRCNAGGMIFLTENIPYTPKMLADELDFEENTVSLALGALENLGMISQDPLSVTNWEEYQNVEGLDRVREQTRKRVADYRAKQKALETGHGEHCSPLQETCNDNVTRYSNVTCNATVTHGNATDIDIERDIELEVEGDKENISNLSLSERKKEKRKKEDAEPTPVPSDEAPAADPVISVFRSFLEREYKKLSPGERKQKEGWFREMMSAFTAYTARRADSGQPLDEEAAQSVCWMLSNSFPIGDWLGFLQLAIGG